MNAGRGSARWMVLAVLCSAWAGALSLAAAGGAAAAGLDPSFGTAGRVISDFGHTETRASALAVAPDGSLVVAGSTCSLPATVGRSCDLALVRYGTDGSELGRTSQGFAAHPDFVVSDLAVDSEGDVIAVGRRYSLGWSPDLIGYLPDGSADAAVSATALPQAFAVKEITAVAVDASDRILLAGESAKNEVLIARLGRDGAADESFGGGDGVATVQQSGPPYVSALAIGSEGRSFYAGHFDIGDPEAGSSGVAALESDGEPAPGFSVPVSFRRELTLGRELTAVRDLKLDSLGRVLLSFEGNGATMSPVARLLPTGAPDESFGRGGVASMPSCQDCHTAIALGVDAADRPLFAGLPFRVGRYTTAGLPDGGLAPGGSFMVDVAGHPEADDLAIDGAGRVVVAGSSIAADGHSRIILARLLVDGPPATVCRGVAATTVGTAGDDVLVGTAGRDVILARGGGDEIRARGGGDLICAGSGRDVVSGGAGGDRIYGEAGPDRVLGGTGQDRLFGGAGRDVIQGGSDADLLRGSAGADRLLGQSGPDRLFGGAGDDALAGGTGEDVLHEDTRQNGTHE